VRGGGDNKGEKQLMITNEGEFDQDVIAMGDNLILYVIYWIINYHLLK